MLPLQLTPSEFHAWAHEIARTGPGSSAERARAISEVVRSAVSAGQLFWIPILGLEESAIRRSVLVDALKEMAGVSATQRSELLAGLANAVSEVVLHWTRLADAAAEAMEALHTNAQTLCALDVGRAIEAAYSAISSLSHHSTEVVFQRLRLLRRLAGVHLAVEAFHEAAACSSGAVELAHELQESSACSNDMQYERARAFELRARVLLAKDRRAVSRGRDADESEPILEEAEQCVAEAIRTTDTLPHSDPKVRTTRIRAMLTCAGLEHWTGTGNPAVTLERAMSLLEQYLPHGEDFHARALVLLSKAEHCRRAQRTEEAISNLERAIDILRVAPEHGARSTQTSQLLVELLVSLADCVRKASPLRAGELYVEAVSHTRELVAAEPSCMRHARRLVELLGAMLDRHTEHIPAETLSTVEEELLVVGQQVLPHVTEDMLLIVHLMCAVHDKRAARAHRERRHREAMQHAWRTVELRRSLLVRASSLGDEGLLAMSLCSVARYALEARDRVNAKLASDQALAITRARMEQCPGDHRGRTELGLALAMGAHVAEALKCYSEAHQLRREAADLLDADRVWN
jgi:tetratricopeptide (TPR) repeat protein